VLLTNVPTARMTAVAIAEHYRGRWTIEGMFGELEAALRAWIDTGRPVPGVIQSLLLKRSLPAVSSGLRTGAPT